jgi:precorrin-6B methylase 2
MTIIQANMKTNGGAMKMIRKLSLLLLWFLSAWSSASLAQEKKLREPDIHYQPSSPAIVEAMLKLAKVRPEDVVYDLGCGDGRIVIEAVKRYGARGVGIDIDPQRIKESRENAAAAGVTDRATFRNEDLFESDIRDATVVTLFLWGSVNIKLRPRLLNELKPGTRVVSHYWDMDEWKFEKRIEVEGHQIYLWTIPERK